MIDDSSAAPLHPTPQRGNENSALSSDSSTARTWAQAAVWGALGCLVLIGTVTLVNLLAARDHLYTEHRSRAVVTNLERVSAELRALAAARATFLAQPSNAYLNEVTQIAQRIDQSRDALRETFSKDPTQSALWTQADRLIDERIDEGRAAANTPRPNVPSPTQKESATAPLQRQLALLMQSQEGRAEDNAIQVEKEFSAAITFFLVGTGLALALLGSVLLASRRVNAQRIAIEEALQTQESLLHSTWEDAEVALIATDPSGRIIKMNVAAEHLTGWTAAEARQRPVDEVLQVVNAQTQKPHPLSSPPRATRLESVQDYALVTREKGVRPVSLIQTALRFRGSSARGSLFQLRDLTAEQKTRAELIAVQKQRQAEQSRFDFIFNTLPIGISYASFTAEGKETRLINDAHLALCGLNRDEISDPQNFARITHPDDRAQQAQLRTRLEEKKIDRYSMDKRYLRANGEVVWVILQFQRQHHPDGSFDDLSTVIDVTDRKEAENALERFYVLSLDLLCIASADGYFKRVSPSVTKLLGWSPEEFQSQTFLEFVHPDDRESTLAAVQRQVAAGETIAQLENRYLHKDGTWRLLSWKSVPQPGGLMYASARDVTDARREEAEIKRLNVTLQEHATQVELANRELEKFTYSVSHDLRAPLRHIQGYVTRLTNEKDAHRSEASTRLLAKIFNISQQLGLQIDALLTFAQLGRMEMYPALINLNELFLQVRQELEPVLADRKVHWTLHPLPTVRGDRSMIKLAFFHLLNNAIKYTRQKAVAQIEIGYVGQEDDRAILYLRDNGTGFDMKYVHKIFGVFERLHPAEEYEGTGMGLALVQRIVQRHSGRIWAESHIGQGTTLFLTLLSDEKSPQKTP